MGGGVRGAGGGARGPSHAAYYVALAGIALLLLLLCCYFFYFCMHKINEMSELETLTATRIPSSAHPPPTTLTPLYPVQPVVRDSASAMAKICRQLPVGSGTGAGAAAGSGCGKGDAVFPLRSPAATREGLGPGNTGTGAADKLPVPALTVTMHDYDHVTVANR